MEPINVKINCSNLIMSPGYIFDSCPLKLALLDMYPDAFISIGGKKAIIIHKKNEDKHMLLYSISDNYDPSIDKLIAEAKTTGRQLSLDVVLTYISTQENYFLNAPSEDHIVETVPQLPPDLFAD